MIPDFDSIGNLPPGIHEVSWSEIVIRFGANPHRRRLLSGMEKALQALETAGCKIVYIDGSFVTSKEVPNDFDILWDTTGVNPFVLDQVIWNLRNGTSAQKAKYGGEFFPAHCIEKGTGLAFQQFFSIDKESGKEKGMVALKLDGGWNK